MLTSRRAALLTGMLLLAASLWAAAAEQQRSMTIEEAVDTLRRDPKNAAAQALLNGIIAADRDRYQKVVAPLHAPLDGGRRHQIVKDAYASLLRGLDDDIVAISFVKGVRDFDKGRLLSAWDRFSFVAAMDPVDDWMVSETQSYLTDKIPAAVAAKAAALKPAVQDAYRRGWAAQTGRQWGLLLRIWRHWSQDPAFAETTELAPAVERREAAQGLSLQGLRAQLDRGIQNADSSPATSVELLEPLLYQSDWMEPSALKQARDVLARSYARAEFDDKLVQMRAAYKANDLERTRRMIVAVLAKEPKNPEAAAFLAKLQQRASFHTEAKTAPKTAAVKPAAPVKTARAQPAPPAAAAAATAAPAPAANTASASAHALTDQVQADAYYNRGLGAYYRGDLAKAAAEWKKAAELDPANEKTRLALKRVSDELVLEKQKASGGAQ